MRLPPPQIQSASVRHARVTSLIICLRGSAFLGFVCSKLAMNEAPLPCCLARVARADCDTDPELEQTRHNFEKG